MKKILLTAGILLLTLNAGFCADNCDYSCVQPYDLSHVASRFMSTVSGSNFLAKKIAQTVIKKQISKFANGYFKVYLDSYSVKDLKKGIFKDFGIEGKNVNINGITFSSLKVKSICKFNYISQQSGQAPVFKVDFPVSFEAVLSEDDINNAMKTPSYGNVLDNVNKLSGSTGLFKVSSTNVKIKDNKFYYIFKISIPFIKNLQDIVITTDFKVQDGEIDFTNTKLISSKATLDLKFIDRVVNYLNPLEFSLEVLENKNADLSVKEVKIIDNKIHAKGIIVIPKDEV